MLETIGAIAKGSLTAILVVLAVTAVSIGLVFFALYAFKIWVEDSIMDYLEKR
jgi:hypothetical protein